MTPVTYYSDKAPLEPLEVDIDKLRVRNARLRDRAATLENVAQAMSRMCYLRRSGFCAAECQGQMLCNLDDLKMLPWHDLPQTLKEDL